MSHAESARELRLGAVEIAGLQVLPIAEENGARGLADWLDDRAAELERP